MPLRFRRLSPIVAPLIAVGAVLATCIAPSARAQGILLAPTAIVIEDRAKSGAITMVNPGSSLVEVTISTGFGYPATDSAGVMYLKLHDAGSDVPPMDTANSAASWLRLFPARLRLAPGERRTVRMMVTPPDSLADGEHWARLIVASRVVRPVTEAADAADRTSDIGRELGGDVQLGLTMEVRAVLPVFYRHGKPSTGVSLDTPRVRLDRDSAVVRIALRRTGNSAFIGSLRATLSDANGVVLRTATLPLGVYDELDPRIAISIDGLHPGAYGLTVDAISHRADVPRQLILQSPTVSIRTPVTISRASGAASTP